MPLAPTPFRPQEGIVQIFAEIAPRFGLSRPAGQCLAAIWRAAQAPSADDLVAGLGLSRSNVSVALKELRAQGLVQVARSPGSRKDYFVADSDPWALLHCLLAERYRRDLAPLAERLDALAQEGSDPRAAALADAAQTGARWIGRLARLDPRDLAQTAEEGGKKKKKKRD